MGEGITSVWEEHAKTSGGRGVSKSEIGFNGTFLSFSSNRDSSPATTPLLTSINALPPSSPLSPQPLYDIPRDVIVSGSCTDAHQLTLLEMGFQKKDIIDALVKTKGNLEDAIEELSAGA